MIKKVLPLLIDGYNLLHAVFKDTSSTTLEAQRGALLRQLSAYQATKEVAITIVFDGSEEAAVFQPRDRYGAIDIVFTHRGVTADDWIIGECEAKPGAFVVVTNDRQIATTVETYSCWVVSCQEFLSRLRANLEENDDNFIAFEKLEMEDLPLYPKVSTKKRGSAKKLPKRARKKQQFLNRL